MNGVESNIVFEEILFSSKVVPIVTHHFSRSKTENLMKSLQSNRYPVLLSITNKFDRINSEVYYKRFKKVIR